MNNCRNCKFCHLETESWEMPSIYYYECSAIPSRANLPSFPFKRTKCDRFCQREKPLRINLVEVLKNGT